MKNILKIFEKKCYCNVLYVANRMIYNYINYSLAHELGFLPNNQVETLCFRYMVEPTTSTAGF